MGHTIRKTAMMMRRPPQTKLSILQWPMWPCMLLLLFSASPAFLLFPVVDAQECTADGRCDTHERCSSWQEDGECIRNPEYMLQTCPASCARMDEDDEENGNGATDGDGAEDDTEACVDRHKHCPQWAELGECLENPVEMDRYCAKSCGLCTAADDVDDPNCTNTHENCDFWASKGECVNNPNYMLVGCAKACHACGDQQKARILKQAAAVEAKSNTLKTVLTSEHIDATTAFGEKQRAEGAQAAETLEIIEKSVIYMQSDQFTALSAEIRENCQNRNELCAFWAVIGECDNNKAYMQTNCAPSCRSCHMIDIDARCPKLKDLEPALHPGDLNKMFERIVRLAPGNRTDSLTESELKEYADQKMPLYTVHIHSRPGDTPATEISVALDKSLPPWVVTFENFVTDEECATLIALGYEHEYKRSEDVGAEKFDGSHEAVQSERRTSENAWCSDHGDCRPQEVPQRLHERMATVMGIPANNSEDFQILKYEKGQFYRTHHDFIPHQVDRQCGPRILTFFLYLSDVEAGGGTNFPQLDLTIEPKRGRALLWPSILNSNPLAKDSRTYHQALEVIEGTKFAANGWIHMYDYVTPQKSGCT